jgi:hypothetical protein
MAQGDSTPKWKKWKQITDIIPGFGVKMPYKSQGYEYNNGYSISLNRCTILLFYTVPDGSIVDLDCTALGWLPNAYAEEAFARQHQQEILSAVEVLREKIWKEHPEVKSTCIHGYILGALISDPWTYRKKKVQEGSTSLQNPIAQLTSKHDKITGPRLQRLQKSACTLDAGKVSALQYYYLLRKCHC